ncbi:MAG: ABC transporter permease [bacterium]
MLRIERVHDLLRDLRFARRQLAKRPVFTIAATLTLALAIGANTAIFSAVNSVLLHPLPVGNTDELVFVHDNLPKLPLNDQSLDPAETMELAGNPGVFQEVAGFANSSPIMIGGSEARRMPGALTLGGFFDLFGVRPEAGRFFTRDESIPGHHRVVVISYDLWQDLGGLRSIIGTKVQFVSGSYEVVGVAPKGFHYPRTALLWMPFQITPESRINHGRLMMTTIGRLRPGVTPAALQAHLVAAARKTHPGISAGTDDFHFSSRSFIDEIAGELRPALLALLGAVGLVLLIACANIASLQLVHGAARSRELAVRTALGADRGAIVRQLLVESLALSLLGGVVGLVLGVAILQALGAAGGAELPALAAVKLDTRVLAFTAVATIVSGMLFGIVPALRASRVDLQSGLKQGRGQSAGVGKNRLLQAGVMIQMALTLMLLLGSTLMIRTVSTLLAQNPGFSADAVSTVRVSVSGPRFAEKGAMSSFYDGVLDALSHSAGILSVGLVSELPFTGGTDSSPFSIEGMPEDASGPRRHANMLAAGGDYFTTMGIPVRRGRAFDANDRGASEPVAIIDEELAKQFFGAANPLGRRISQGGTPATIVGIVGTVSQKELGETAKATVYYPLTQHDWYPSTYLVVRSSSTFGAVTPVVRRAISGIESQAAVFDPRELADRVRATLAPRQLTMTVLSGLAAVSLLLAIFGLYGVISYVVSERSTEFGIRVALGAQSRHVLSIVVWQGMYLAFGGIGIGLLAATAGTKALGALLFGVSASDPVSFALAAGVLALVAIVASYLPALRATRINALDVLRRGE